MREIKFRAWDGTKIISYENGDTQPVYDSEGAMPDEIIHITHKIYGLIWMQYTGLKDRHGVEVYEGDILRIPASNEYEVANYNSFEVFWHDNDSTPTDCGLVLGRLTPHGNSAGGYGGYKLVAKHVSQMEVIGDIYENPELLK